MPTISIADEAHWLSVRESNIGGSEVSALFNRWLLSDGSVVTLHCYEPVPEGAFALGCCNPYQTSYSLFLAKSGRVMPDDFASNERMDAGTHLEPAIAQWAMAKFGMKLRKVRRYHTHPTVTGWGASVDYEVHGPGMHPVEIKNVDSLIALRQWVIEGDEIQAVPLHITLQLQHYIGARDTDRGWLLPCIGGNKLLRREVEAHGPTLARITEAVTAFWQGVRTGTAPVQAADYGAVADEFAYADKGAPPADLSGDDEAARLARRLMRLKRHVSFVETVESNVKGRLALKVGESSKATGDGFKVSWPVIQRKAKLIEARMQTESSYRGGFTVSAVGE